MTKRDTPEASLPFAEAHHVVNAPPEAVFDAWITPHMIEEWWAPEGFTTKVLRLDPWEGGQFIYEMTAPNGVRCNMTGAFRQIARPTLLVMDIIDHCNINLPEGIEPQLAPALVSVTFRARGLQTEVVVKHTPLNPTYLLVAKESWRSTLEKLARRLKA